MAIVEWRNREDNYSYDVVIDEVYLQLQFNKIEEDVYMYVVIFKDDVEDSDVFKEVIEFIDDVDAPVDFDKVLFTSNNQDMIKAFYRYIEENEKYQKKISYINGRPFPSLVNDSFTNVFEGFKKTIKNLFEIRKEKDNYTEVLYSTKSGNIKFMNYTYDYSEQTYKVLPALNVTEDDFISVLKNFLKEKEPNILIFNHLDKKTSSFLEQNDFKKEDSRFVYKKEDI